MGDGDSTAAAPGCIAWDSYSITELLGFLPDDLRPGWDHAAAWRLTVQTADSYGQSLQKIRDGFATVWPPEHSGAARMFLDRLDSMIAALADVRDCGASNYMALTGVLQVLDDTRSKIEHLHAEAQSVDVSDSLALTRQAQQHMATADDEIVPYYFKLTQPASWTPWSASGSDGSISTPGPEDLSEMPGRRTMGEARRSVLPWVGKSSAADGLSPRRSPSGGSVIHDAGPILTGNSAPLSEAVSLGSENAVSVPGTESMPVPAVSPPWMVQTPAGSVMRFGTVIGGSPPKPVDEVLGEPRPGTGSSSALSEPLRADTGTSSEEPSARGSDLLTGAAGGDIRSSRRRRRHLEPHFQWETREGVPPVIEPGPEPKHDPGPGVIGIDR